ncbi:hypothetical protein EMIT0196P_170082 [Pseudomonas chlororaphis]
MYIASYPPFDFIMQLYDEGKVLYLMGVYR